MKRQKQLTSVRIYVDQLKLSKEIGLNMSRWIRDKFDEEFGCVDSIDFKISELDEELKLMKKKKEVILKTLKANSISEDEFFTKAKEAISENMRFLEPQVRRYKKIFKKLITEKDFLKKCKIKK